MSAVQALDDCSSLHLRQHGQHLQLGIAGRTLLIDRLMFNMYRLGYD